MLQTLGADVLDERPFEVRRIGRQPVPDLRFRADASRTRTSSRGADDAELRTRFSEAFIAAWAGRSEVDGFNQLVLAAGLNWREVAVLRSYAHYLRQIGTPYTQRYVEQVLNAPPADRPPTWPSCSPCSSTRTCSTGDRGRRSRAGRAEQTARPAITAALDAVTSLDADRILRTLLSVITRDRRGPTSTGSTSRATGATSCPSSWTRTRFPGVPETRSGT